MSSVVTRDVSSPGEVFRHQSRECFSGGSSWKQRISVEAIERKLIFSYLGLEIKDNVAWAVAAGCAPRRV